MEDMIPARRVLTEAEETNRRLGHENLGFLSASHGFLPIEPPRLTLPESHHAWDEVAAELPELFRTVGLRRRLDHMPILSGVENELPDDDLYRAAAILGIFSHAYHYVEPAPYTRIPDSILKPWAEISRRLHRPAPHLSFIDLNIYNWRLIDASLPDPMQMENLRLLIPIVGNEDERRFQCTPIEIVARFTPLLTSVIRAQEAASQDDRFVLKQELILLSDSFHNLTHTSLMKVNPSAYHPLYVDPVVWGKTVAPLATPFQEGNAIPGPSGTAIPTFTLMDIFFGRLSFSTTVGHETERTRAWFPPHWQKLLKAAEQISVPGYVKQVRDSELTGLFQQALDSYSGETGLIGRHRLKAYGFLDLSFKAGRSRTLGGFEGGFEDRLWKATLGEREHITRIVPPETFRTYSISSRMTDQEANELQLTIVRLRYQTRETPVSRATLRTGTGSGFLRRLGASSGVKARRISIKIIHPPHFSLPVDASRPVVMFAGGTGIAPFRSLLQARVSQPAGGENWLFFGTRTRSELYYQPEWERFIAGRHLNLQTIFSREDGRLTTRNGQLVFTEGARGRIDQVMLTPETDEMLWKLIQQGAFFYVCGRTGFAKRVMKTLQKIITHHVGDDQARQFFYRLVGEGRYLQEVFTTYAGPQLEQARSYPASEVVLHNNPEVGYWFIINGRVYDVSEFAHLHPGGLKIIQSYAGMDATISYKKAQHDINPEVDSLLGMYQLGAVRRLSFGSGGGIAITPRGLQFVPLTELYQTWIHFLYMVVEMENALLNDYSIRTEQVTYDETRGKPRSSRYRMQLLLQTHERFLHGYLARVSGRALEHLWALTSGLCSDHQDYRWMQKQIADIEASASAQAARALGMQAQSLLNAAASDRLAELEQLTDRLSETNREFLEQMKLGLRRGVQVFETFEKQTITQGRAQLLEAIGSIPQVLTDYYEKLNSLS